MRIGLGKYFMTGHVTAILNTAAKQVFPSGLNLRAGLLLKADSGNANMLYVGDAAVNSLTGYPIRPGEETFLRVDDVSGVFLISNVSGTNNCWWFAT